MKSFLKRKWHRIPVGIVAVLLALVLVAGSAFAAGWFTFVEGTAEVTVVEAIEITILDGDGIVTGDQDIGYTWTVSLMAGETKTTIGSAKNLSSAPLELRGLVWDVPAGLAVHSYETSLEDPFPIAARATQEFPIQVTAAEWVETGVFTIHFAFQRGSSS